MTWFAVDDRFWSHPKTLRMRESEHYCSAVTLWTAAGSWCAGHAWDTGVVPAPVLASLGVTPWREALALLVDVGLWDKTVPLGDGPAVVGATTLNSVSVVFHDWASWNGPEAKSWRISRRLENDRERQRRRRGAKQSAAENRAASRDRKAHSRRQRCDRGEHGPDCPAGCPARAKRAP